MLVQVEDALDLFQRHHASSSRPQVGTLGEQIAVAPYVVLSHFAI